jgi:hypothetical protein
MANCFHSGCKCDHGEVERAGQQFCSSYCAETATQGSLGAAMCNCGHADCSKSRQAQTA